MRVRIFQIKFWKKAYNQNIIRIYEIQSCFCCESVLICRSKLDLSKHLQRQREIRALQRTTCMFLYLYLSIHIERLVLRNWLIIETENPKSAGYAGSSISSP